MLETDYTSSRNKLLHHLDRLYQAQTEGVFRPVMLELAPTNRCDLSCCFCSVANRDLSDELSLSQLSFAIQQFLELGLLSVEITGGGDPLCHPQISRIVDLLHSENLELGLITNGLRLNTALSQDHLGKFEWIRISLNGLDYDKNPTFQIPEDVTLGFSYVWNKLSTVSKLDKINEYVEEYDAEYVRVVPDCLSKERIDKARREVPSLIEQYPNFFFSTKGYDKPHECWLGYFRPFLNADGYVYRCSANPLINRRFHPDFRMCHYTEIISYWRRELTAYPTVKCGLCFFKTQNDLISTVMHPVEHDGFI